MINHKIFKFNTDLDSLRANISLALITLALIGAYLPGKASSFFIVPALVVLWVERRHICIDSGIKRISLFYLAYLITFTVTSQNFLISLDGVYHVIRGMLFFPLALIFAQLAGRQGLFIVNILAAICIAGNLGFGRNYLYSSGIHFFSYYLNPNNAGVHFLGLLVLTIPNSHIYKRRLSIWLNWTLSGIGAALGLCLLALTNARGAWLGLAGSIIVLLGIKRGIPVYIKIAVGTISFALLFVLLLFFNLKGFNLDLREVLWKGLFNATIQDHLIFGHGIEMVRQVIVQKELITVTAHNMFLEIFVCSGLLGVIWILSIAFLLIRHLIRLSYQQNTLWCMGLFGLVAFLIMAQFDLKFFGFRFNASLSFFLGLVYAQRIPLKNISKNEL